MNNRYICKAKRVDNGEWVEGLFSIRDFAGREYYAIERREKKDFYHVSRVTVSGQCNLMKLFLKQ